jgi:hypothetical protein
MNGSYIFENSWPSSDCRYHVLEAAASGGVSAELPVPLIVAVGTTGSAGAAA